MDRLAEHKGARYLAIMACWLLLGLFSASRLRIIVPDMTWGRALLYGLPDGLLWAILTPVPVAIARHFPLPAPRALRNAAVHLVVGACVAVVHTQLDALQNAVREFLISGESHLGHLSRKLLLNAFHMNLLIYLLIAGVAMYAGRLRSLREGERRAARLRNQLTEARLAALRAQTRPHFLFNTLHTVGALIDDDATAGRRVLRRLGDLLRASLSTDGEQEIPLHRELELTRAYLEIEQARLGERLSVEIDVDDEAADCSIPALLLQPLVENAIRHGVSRSSEPGWVRVVASCVGAHLRISVRDSGSDAPGPSPGAGIGLASVRERLQAHYGDDHSVEITSSPAFTVTISIPFRTIGPASGVTPATQTRRAS